MPESLGFSVYLSTFQDQWPLLSKWAHSSAPVFLSLNMGKGQGDPLEAEKICRKLYEEGFRVIADVSTETCSLFEETDLLSLARRLGLWALRIDYGFSPEEIAAMAEKMPIVLNASTTDPRDAKEILSGAGEIFALHNFYPRPETGLDEELFLKTTRGLQAALLKVLAFIPGDSQKRGPIFEGLPTLECHRNVLPSAAFADLALTYGVDDIFVGDPGISEEEQRRIRLFCEENILSVPADLEEDYAWLYGLTFTCRVDSPRWIIRLEESRTVHKIKNPPAPKGPEERSIGTITMDNTAYGRYAGEIQILREHLKPEERVNVIGHVPENAQLLLPIIGGGQKFRLVKP